MLPNFIVSESERPWGLRGGKTGNEHLLGPCYVPGHLTCPAFGLELGLSRRSLGPHSSNEDTGLRAEKLLARCQTWFAEGDAELMWNRCSRSRRAECAPPGRHVPAGRHRKLSDLAHRGGSIWEPAPEWCRGPSGPFTVWDELSEADQGEPGEWDSGGDLQAAVRIRVPP